MLDDIELVCVRSPGERGVRHITREGGGVTLCGRECRTWQAVVGEFGVPCKVCLRTMMRWNQSPSSAPTS